MDRLRESKLLFSVVLNIQPSQLFPTTQSKTHMAIETNPIEIYLKTYLPIHNFYNFGH